MKCTNKLKLAFQDKIKLFFSLHGNVIPKTCFKNRVTLEKLYNKGTQKIERMLDLFKIIKDNRKFKIILQNSLMNQEVAEQLKRTEKFEINLEEESSDRDLDTVNQLDVKFDAIA